MIKSMLVLGSVWILGMIFGYHVLEIEQFSYIALWGAFISSLAYRFEKEIRNNH